MSIDAMKLALEVLEEMNELSIGEHAICLPAEIDTAMDALRQAIEQAEQAQPVAWRWKERINGELDSWVVTSSEPPPYAVEKQPLYTAPPQRQWVDLTADEIWQCNVAPAGHHVECHICVAHQNVLDFAEVIEAKLKEKNCG